MAATRAATASIAAGTSNGAGSTTTGSIVDVSTGYGGTISYKLTNGGTGPTVAPTLNFYGSSDNFATAGKKFYAIGGDTAASSINEGAVDVPIGFKQLRVDCTGNTGQAVTCEAIVHVLTGV